MNELTRQRIHAQVEARLLPPPALPVRMPLPTTRWLWGWLEKPMVNRLLRAA